MVMSPYASFRNRVAAYLFDNLVFYVLMTIFGWVVPVMDVHSFLLYTIAVNCIWAAYNIVCHAYKGQTFGKKIFRVRLVVSGTNTVPGLGRCCLREVPWLLVGGFLLYYSWNRPSSDIAFELAETNYQLLHLAVYFAWCLMQVVRFFTSRNRQTLPDVVAGTEVRKTHYLSPVQFEFEGDAQ